MHLAQLEAVQVIVAAKMLGLCSLLIKSLKGTLCKIHSGLLVPSPRLAEALCK